MRMRFNKAAFYFGRVKYGHALPAPRITPPKPGAGTLRRQIRERVKAEAVGPAAVKPPGRQQLRRQWRRAEKAQRKLEAA